jgi:hypothetical protein
MVSLLIRGFVNLIVCVREGEGVNTVQDILMQEVLNWNYPF